MFASFLITFRETLEAALIIGLVFAFLKKSNEEKLYKHAYLGIFAGIILSIISAVLFNTLAGGFVDRSEEIFEGVTMLIGAILLTTVIIFMQNHGKHLKKKMSHEMEKKEGFGIFLLVLVSILREGVETVIFLAAASYATGISIVESVLGVVIAIALGYLIYRTSINVNIKKFFAYSSFLLILFAAGLVAHGVHELEEAKVLNPIVEHVWDINPPAPLAAEGIYPLFHEKGGIGLFLTGIFGYNANPSLLEVISYVAYLITIVFLAKHMKKNPINA